MKNKGICQHFKIKIDKSQPGLFQVTGLCNFAAHLRLLVVPENLVSAIKNKKSPLPGLDLPSLLHQIAGLVIRLVHLQSHHEAKEEQRVKSNDGKKKRKKKGKREKRKRKKEGKRKVG